MFVAVITKKMPPTTIPSNIVWRVVGPFNDSDDAFAWAYKYRTSPVYESDETIQVHAIQPTEDVKTDV